MIVTTWAKTDILNNVAKLESQVQILALSVSLILGKLQYFLKAQLYEKQKQIEIKI